MFQGQGTQTTLASCRLMVNMSLVLCIAAGVEAGHCLPVSDIEKSTKGTMSE